MRRGFKIDGKKYSYIPCEKLDLNKLNLSSEVFRYKYLKIGCAFDIETTSYYSEKYDKDLATMYIWQLAIDKDTIIGRTWKDFVRVLETLNDYAEKCDGVILCLVQNLSFEFQFIKSILNWNKNSAGYPDIFAKDDRTILYAKYKNIEFRDTLALTNMGLARFQKNYNLDIGKLSGDLDYSLLRHFRSNVTPRELSYCINDVQVLSNFFYKYLLPEFIIPGKKIPLTSTGLVRVDIKSEFMELPKEERRILMNRIRNAQPSEALYKLMRNYLFRGGLVHASTIACNYLWDEKTTGGPVSMDIKSAHPSYIFAYPMPWKYNRRNPSTWNDVLKQAREGSYSFLGIFKFYNIRTSGYHSLESKNKIIEASPDAVYENGRLVYATYIKVALLDLDFFNYEDLYEWKDYKVTVLYQARLEILPDYVRKTVCKYFMLKETLPKDSVEYGLAKRKLNGIFGMASTSLPSQEVVFNPETNEMELSAQTKSYDELTRYLLMLPQWSCYIAARTRRTIVLSIKECGFDSLYYDTDSQKIINYEKHKAWFDNFNKERMEINAKTETYGYDKKIFERIGCFEWEYQAKNFLVQGSKRYISEYDGKIHVTVAGMVKGSLEEYVKKLQIQHVKNEIPKSILKCKCLGQAKDTLEEEIYNYISDQEAHNMIWDIFNDDLVIPAGDSMKKTAVYTDKGFIDTLTDYEGKTEVIEEGSCVAIIDIPFTMSMEEEFLLRIASLIDERKRMIYKGVL